MKKKINYILLIDDDEVFNFLNEVVIRQVDCVENVVAVQSGEEGLKVLQELKAEGATYPELIFLDINMPVMNGWEFIDNYKQLEFGHHNHPVLIMLTSSENPGDRARAAEVSVVNEYLNKPLTVETFQQILETNFSGRC